MSKMQMRYLGTGVLGPSNDQLPKTQWEIRLRSFAARFDVEVGKCLLPQTSSVWSDSARGIHGVSLDLVLVLVQVLVTSVHLMC